jgi:hypothetical protein
VSAAEGPGPDLQLQPSDADSVAILSIGTAVWVVALALTLLVPALHTGPRHWWPWSAVVGVVGGTLATLYVRRGRGNAASA